tara:strand:+ start:85 stop:1248 length:1164 start_codon:yes stop_codon:yes gene_type:complete
MEETNKEEVPQEAPKNENVTKVKVKSLAIEPEVYKVDLSEPVEPKQEVEERKEEITVVNEDKADIEEAVEEAAQEENVNNEIPAIEEVTDEVVTEEEVIEALDANEETGKDIPENVRKLMDFMDETGGDLQDYVNLNRNVKDLDSQDALLEYYKRTKPHLDSGEINFLMEDNFSFDEEVDDERDIKRKKLALKEQVAEAKAYLDGQKSKYYEDIKAGSKLTTEQQKAVEFFNRHTKESKENQSVAEKQKANFTQKTNQVFNDKFKGFDFKVGDKKFRYNVKDVSSTKETQSDINNFIGKFLDESNSMSDARGYHKGLFTAMNPDTVAQHFYEQGKADALREGVAKAKNINTTARKSHGETTMGGLKFKVLGNNSNDFKVRIKNKNNN